VIVVFDLDGTLVDASRLHSSIIEEVTGVKIPPAEIYLSSSFNFLLMKNLPKGQWSSIKDITRRHESEMLGRVKMVEPVPGVYDMLEKLKVKKAVFTSASRRLCDAMLKHCHLAGYFDFIVTGDDVSKPKPDPEGLYLISDKLDEDNLVYVGNSEKDLLASKKFGATFILFSKDERTELMADYTASTLKEVGAIIESLA
jgi:pyrophosphatase PpaX